MILVLAGNNVKNVGFIVDQVWPLGNLFVSSQDQKTLRPEESITLGYLNVPFVRLCIQTIYLVFIAVRLMKSQNFQPDYFVVFSCLTKRWKGSPSVWAVKVLSSIFRIPWVCVVGDVKSQMELWLYLLSMVELFKFSGKIKYIWTVGIYKNSIVV